MSLSFPNKMKSVLMTAASREKLETVRVLLNAGADVNYTMPDGSTALHFATFEGRAPQVIRALFEAGADV
jgi:ankyrin repeat protein